MRSIFTHELRPCIWTILYRMWTVPAGTFAPMRGLKMDLKPIPNEKPVAVGAANYLL